MGGGRGDGEEGGGGGGGGYVVCRAHGLMRVPVSVYEDCERVCLFAKGRWG